MEWISVLDKMPEKVLDNENDLNKNCKLVLFNRCSPALVSNNFIPSEDGIKGITHWMNIPKLEE